MPCSLVCDVPRKALYVVLSNGKLLKYRVLHGVGGASVNFEKVDPNSSRRSVFGRGAADPNAWECENCSYLHTGSEAGCSKCTQCQRLRPKNPALEAMAIDAPEGAALLGRELFVTCAQWHRVVAFDTETLAPLRSFGRHGRGLGHLRCPQGLAALDAGVDEQELYIAVRVSLRARTRLVAAAKLTS